MRLARELFAVTFLFLASAGLVRAQTIVTQGAGEPARLDGPWLLYEDDPPGGQIAPPILALAELTGSAPDALQPRAPISSGSAPPCRRTNRFPIPLCSSIPMLRIARYL